MLNRSYIKGHEGHFHHFSDESLLQFRKNLEIVDKQGDIALILKNLSDPTKLSIFLLLHRVDEIPVTDIVHVLDSSQSTISHALSDLKKLGLVECHRCGQLVCYSLKKQSKKRNDVLIFLEKLFRQKGGV